MSYFANFESIKLNDFRSIVGY